MPFVLAIETSTPRGSIALLQDGVLAFEEHFTSHRSHNSRLFDPLGKALEMSGGGLRLLVVGTGPGSYTGARIGIAAAQGVALSRKVPVIGLPSVLVPDVPELPDDFVLCGDARRGCFFMAEVSKGMLWGAIGLHAPDAFRNTRANDASRLWFSYDPKVPLDLPDILLTAPSAARLAGIASALMDESVWTLEQRPLEPAYLQAPFITTPKSNISPTTVPDTHPHSRAS